MPPARGLILLYSASEVLPVSAGCSENVPTVSGRRFRISMRISSVSVKCRFGTGARTLLLLAMSLVEIKLQGDGAVILYFDLQPGGKARCGCADACFWSRLHQIQGVDVPPGAGAQAARA